MDMRKLIDLLEAKQSGNKLDTSAFIYLDPKGKDFAQCSTCNNFLPNKKRCSIFGKNDEVVANASCGLYVHGQPHDDQKIISAVTPKEAGYVLGQVRCENCSWFNTEKSTCGLFDLLNKADKDVFDMNINVKPKGCCNAWQKKS